jgi:hypothetical protein
MKGEALQARDYIDADVAYLLGLLVARGELNSSENVYRMIVHFPKGSLLASGETLHFDTDKEIRLGTEKIRERLLELLDGDIRTIDAGDSWDLVARFTRQTMAWRNVQMLLAHRTSFHYFDVPEVLFAPETPVEFKREFMRGFADVAGNIRPANADQVGRHRVRLDTLNYRTTWHAPVRLCLLLQEQLGIPVPNIVWGHPNLGREWREHQLNVYVEDFLAVGFYFDYKQSVLDELAKSNLARFASRVKGCPGARRLNRKKDKDAQEGNAEKLPDDLVGKHFDAYWQICRTLGCPRRPRRGEQLELLTEE